ncbi:MAG: OFA family MFS transporter [candidate division WOR-3 bacterium]|nr:OFA family MFS transporter [candidate division WOR-3 bacterium]MCX7837509.1 OFA family MFS transporter [candidate division WOR-3 bacterium]MDW8114269.1 OFA family MFS transporter [candidate division WOR-3 bacterium]
MSKGRWFVMIGAVLIQLCLGAIYAWSVFRKPLQGEPLNLTPTQATLPFAFVLISFALSTILGGRWQDKKGPRIVAITGGILLGSGLILSGLTKSFLGILLSYGILSGIGIGLAYVCPISVGVKWFPDMRGLITGIAVAGFGAGALIVAPIARSLIDTINVFNTFIVLGISFLILVIIGALILKNPPEGYKPEGWTPPPTSKATIYSYLPSEMLKTHQFYLIWLIYFFGCATGLMIIGQTSPIGQELAGLTKETAAFAVSLLAIFNAFGRIFWGRVSDWIGRMKTLFLMFLICGIAVFLYTIIPLLPFYYWIGVSLIGLCFGGYLAVFPAVTADFYGTKNVGMNYGLVFTAYGVGGLLGNIFAPQVLERTKSYNLAFVVAGILCILGAIITFLIKQPKRSE